MSLDATQFACSDLITTLSTTSADLGICCVWRGARKRAGAAAAAISSSSRNRGFPLTVPNIFDPTR